MKLQVIGVKRVAGTAKATGAPFDMCTLYAITPIENVNNGKLTVQGGGFELTEIALDPEALPSFQSLKFPCALELSTDIRPYRGEFQAVVVGFTPAARAVANG